MASTTLPPRSPVPGDRVAPSLVTGRGRQRRWSLALLAVLVTLGSALAFVVLWLNAGGRRPVLALRADVAAGQVIEADDLTVVRVSTDGGLTLVASSARDDVVGRPAAANLLAGTLLVPEAVGTSDGLDPGTEVIGIPVDTVRLPSDQLEAGDRVRIFDTGRDDQAGGTPARLIGSGVVFSVQQADDGASEVRVSVTVDDDMVLAIAGAVQADRVYIVQTAAG